MRALTSLRFGIKPLEHLANSCMKRKGKVAKEDACAGWARDKQEFNKDPPLKTHQLEL